jgi:hypothetical protein
MTKMLLLCCLVALISVPSLASPQFLNANNASSGAPYVYQIDPATGAVLNTYTHLQGSNGRGVVDVNNILYYTTSGDSNVYKYDITTNTQLGVAFNVAGASVLEPMGSDPFPWATGSGCESGHDQGAAVSRNRNDFADSYLAAQPRLNGRRWARPACRPRARSFNT